MLKILIVDDDFLICEELRGIVTDLENEVAGIADSGKAAGKILDRVGRQLRAPHFGR